MTPEERRAILGDAAIADANAQADRASTEHPPPPELLAKLRHIFANPGGRLPAVTRDIDAA